MKVAYLLAGTWQTVGLENIMKTDELLLVKFSSCPILLFISFM
jgi:hypothetical protein